MASWIVPRTLSATAVDSTGEVSNILVHEVDHPPQRSLLYIEAKIQSVKLTVNSFHLHHPAALAAGNASPHSRSRWLSDTPPGFWGVEPWLLSSLSSASDGHCVGFIAHFDSRATRTIPVSVATVTDTMVNCKGVSSTPKSPVNHEICRYCRTRMCEECYLAATSKSSKLQPELPRHQHVCLTCTRLHPDVKELQSPVRERRSSRLPRLNSAPVSGGPRIDSLSNMAREHRARFKPEEQAAAIPKKSTEDRRRRRHTSAIAPSVDFSCPSGPSRARQLLKANATELQVARRRQNATELETSRRHHVQVPTSYSCDLTSIRDATSTQKDLALTMTDLRRAPKPLAKAQSCHLTGSKPIFDMSDDPTALELSTVDLRLPKYKADIPTPTKRGRRVSAADPANSALAPISIEHLAAIDAKLSSVELELKRYDVSPKQEKPKESSISSGQSSKTRKTSEPVDFHLSTMDLRSRARRHTTAEKTKEKKWNSVEVEVKKSDRFALFQRKKKAEPIDFHLSTFDLKPRRQTESKPDSNHGGNGYEEMKAVPAIQDQKTPTYSKNEPCDLAYLDNFRSYTV